ncbi:TPA: response regulator [Candidatus Woesearchaeota archaeon]|nr:hypothetical protein [archaeon]HIJ10920.1 response regulator [Candidatus Woesearchaeota archaeon]
MLELYLVEDSDDDAFMIQRLLCDYDVRITHVETIDDAIASFEPGKYGLILTDYNVGSQTGIEFLAYLQTTYKPEEIPDRFLYSAAISEDAKKAAVAAGAKKVLNKKLFTTKEGRKELTDCLIQYIRHASPSTPPPVSHAV